MKKYSISVTGRYGFICALVVLICSQFFSAGITTYGSKTFVPFCISAIAGTLLTIQISKYIASSKYDLPKRFLMLCGEKTFEILTWHFLSFKLASLLIIVVEDKPIYTLAQFPTHHEQNCHLWWVLYFATGVLLPLFLEKIRIQSKNSIAKIIH